MSYENPEDIPIGMRKVHRRLESWRKRRRGRMPIPKPLWAAAGAVAREHGVFRTSKVLRLEFNKLKEFAERVKPRKRATTPPAQFVNLLATPKEVKTHQHMESLAPSAALAMQLEVSSGSGTTLTMYESIELVATTPNGHAYIDGVFAWEPLAVQVREG